MPFSEVDYCCPNVISGDDGGNSSCVITATITAAEGVYDEAAFGTTLVTSAHPPEVKKLVGAGPKAVADELWSFSIELLLIWQ